jgi:transcriptional regulator with XRE-family HTH domain
MPSPRGFHGKEYETLCKLLKQMRLDARMTQAQMGEELNMTQGMVAKIENGERRIDPIEFCRWCKATGLEPADGIQRLRL